MTYPLITKPIGKIHKDLLTKQGRVICVAGDAFKTANGWFWKKDYEAVDLYIQRENDIMLCHHDLDEYIDKQEIDENDFTAIRLTNMGGANPGGSTFMAMKATRKKKKILWNKKALPAHAFNY